MDNPFLRFLSSNHQDDIKLLLKIIAISIRNNIEDFHVNYLSDSQMKELNPLIRNGIYNALFALANHHKNARCQ
jgi:hypothetical protein